MSTAAPDTSGTALPAGLEKVAVLGLRRDTCAGPGTWQLSGFSGRVIEISGNKASASLTLAFRLVHEAQRQGEPVAWISRRDSVFFPPDAADAGVDIEALAVVWADTARLAGRVADPLLRSGAFALVVLDIGEDDRVPYPLQMRLAGLAKKHATVLLCITEKDNQRPSIGPLVSLRAEAVRGPGRQGRFSCELRVIKDKRRGPGWTHEEVCHGPDGLC